MLVIDGKVHPMFIPGSTDRKPRNGVGVSSPTEVHFAISEDWVNFEEFARFFRDKLGCDDALFLDGGTASACSRPSWAARIHPAMAAMARSSAWWSPCAKGRTHQLAWIAQGPRKRPVALHE
jgi:uncharacterized protein YigE (DUF2233 family)